MMSQEKQNRTCNIREINKSTLNEEDIERLRRDIYRPGIEKFQLFTQMLRANALFLKAKVTHK
jgi:hypothetical protein